MPDFSFKRDYGDEEEEEEEEEVESEEVDGRNSPVTTPLIIPEKRQRGGQDHQQSPILGVLVAALRKSLVTCSVEGDDVVDDMDIGCPTDVRHVSHVTFDRFKGFLGLPVEFLPEIPRRVPSASASIFGVSPQSMQCSYDHRGSSVPTVLLMMQNRLYSEGGLRAEGIFRINAENSQEEDVRNQLNRGVIPQGIDVHCLAGLIKAWFRELPRGILDSLTPEQVMHCNIEDDCTQLVKLLPSSEAALLDWAINLMADVVQHEHYNKMNARNIAVVFAPNMTQMADPLTALIHAVQVMNFLKTLIMKAIREREESAAATAGILLSYFDSPSTVQCEESSHMQQDIRTGSRSATFEGTSPHTMEKFWSFDSNDDAENRLEPTLKASSVVRNRRTLESSFRDERKNEAEKWAFDRLNSRKGVWKLRKHPVFQLSKSVKKSGVIETVNTRQGGWA